MVGSFDAIRAVTNGKRSKPRGILPAGWSLRSRWNAVEPLYIWSAAAGLLVATVLIVVAVLMQTRRLY